MNKNIQKLLNEKAAFYNQPRFIEDDPISVPHRFSKKQDKEIAGFFAAIFAWGNRTTIINKALELMARMDNSPHEFCLHFGAADARVLKGFKHRTFCHEDLYHFVDFFKLHYTKHQSLEDAFSRHLHPADATIENALVGFKKYVFAAEHLKRTQKHISSPAANSACKRLNMYLRWMVRADAQGVDLGLWKTIGMDKLVCPLDVHVARVAKRLGLITRPNVDWKAALELTAQLRSLNPTDPVLYDFALFGLGAEERFV